MNPANRTVEEIAREVGWEYSTCIGFPEERQSMLIQKIADALRTERERAEPDLIEDWHKMNAYAKSIISDSHSVYEVLDEVPKLRAQLAAERERGESDRKRIAEEIEALKWCASDYNTVRQSNDTCVTAGAHDALRWAIGLAETPVSENFALPTKPEVGE